MKCSLNRSLVFPILLFSSISLQVAWSCPSLCNPHGLYSPWNSPGQNTGVGKLFLVQGIFPTQVSCIAGGFFTSQATREAQQLLLSVLIRYRLSNPFLWEDREESKQPKLVGTSKRLVHIRWFIQQIITGTYHGGDLISILGQFSWEDSLEKEMVTHSSIFACRISWTEEPCRLQSMGS